MNFATSASKYREWVFTIFSPHVINRGIDFWKRCKQKSIKYGIVQLEKCPDTNRLHLQGYMECKGPRNMRSVLSFLNITSRDGHVERRRGTRQQARDYCCKDETRVPGTSPQEHGSFSPEPGQGQRRDIHDALGTLRADPTNLQRVLEFHGPAYIKYHRGFEKAAELLTNPEPGPRTSKRCTIVIVGNTGVGKTKAAFQAFPKISMLPKTRGGKLWLPTMIKNESLLDDFRDTDLDFSELLTFTDPWYNSSFECKGGFRTFWSNVLIITTDKHPQQWYALQQDHLKRRVHIMLVNMRAMNNEWSEQECTPENLTAAIVNHTTSQ